METSSWTIGEGSLAVELHAICLRQPSVTSLSVATSLEAAKLNLGRPQVSGYLSPHGIVTRKIINEDAEHAQSLAGKLSNRLQCTVHVSWTVSSGLGSDFDDDIFLSSIQHIISSFSL